MPGELGFDPRGAHVQAADDWNLGIWGSPSTVNYIKLKSRAPEGKDVA